MYGQVLGSPPPAADAPPQVGAPPGAALGIGLGQPPKMPGLPPPPSMTGAMPTGDPSTNKKEAADNAILALREVKGHYPNLAQAVDSTIDQIKSAAKTPAPSKAGLGAPIPPGSPTPDADPTGMSGTPGGF